jgi:hypothetical protein
MITFIVHLVKIFEMMSFYEMTHQYKKVFKTLQRESEDRYKFSETHPGYEFSIETTNYTKDCSAKRETLSIEGSPVKYYKTNRGVI